MSVGLQSLSQTLYLSFPTPSLDFSLFLPSSKKNSHASTSAKLTPPSISMSSSRNCFQLVPALGYFKVRIYPDEQVQRQRLVPNIRRHRWTGNCWYVYNLLKYEFDLQFNIPITYPTTASEIELPQLDGKTQKMYIEGRRSA
ncbi:hypothetical protein C1H46_006483 [Malus baccata]|uniref:Ubiquitin-fold modifier-conjugating enzyme 1 n=1 Tax=Malus baccata TaxID=106549 RepID=A0A540NBS9_MALBA|nr:hypothetical protein C1H46_006483 [Malus baccata]